MKKTVSLLSTLLLTLSLSACSSGEPLPDNSSIDTATNSSTVPEENSVTQQNTTTQNSNEPRTYNIGSAFFSTTDPSGYELNYYFSGLIDNHTLVVSKRYPGDMTELLFFVRYESDGTFYIPEQDVQLKVVKTTNNTITLSFPKATP